MTETEIFEKLRDIISSIMGVSQEIITHSSKQGEIPEWDSLGHLRLIMTIEEDFDVKFSMLEIPKYTSIEALMSEIKRQKNIL